MIARDPAFARAHFYHAPPLAKLERCAAARHEVETFSHLESGSQLVFLRASVEAICGNRARALAAIERAGGMGSWQSFSAGLVHAVLDDRQEAFRLLSQAVDRRDIGVAALPKPSPPRRATAGPTLRRPAAESEVPGRDYGRPGSELGFTCLPRKTPT